MYMLAELTALTGDVISDSAIADIDIINSNKEKIRISRVYIKDSVDYKYSCA